MQTTMLRKYYILLVLYFFVQNYALSQMATMNEPILKGKTYAVIIGISQYQNTVIPKLNYADKDATLFAEWLKSKAGGSVPDNQIKLFTNETATIAAIYNGLDWLTAIAQKEDVVYLYFSGHGDMEIDSASISQGYLLAYNSPPNNYAKNAVSINDVNHTANTLTTKNEAKVILITDACHSGKLAGDFFKGKQLTARNLRAVQNTQVRMTSCADNEEAAEGPAWGEGRGVFSYYLLLGLNGVADSLKDNIVKLNELNKYMGTALSQDETLKKDNFKQHPVIVGNDLIPIAKIDSATLEIMQAYIKNKTKPITNPPAGLQSLKLLGKQPIDYFFEFAKKDEFDFNINLNKYIDVPADSVPSALVSDYLASLVMQQSSLSPWDGFGNYNSTLLTNAENRITKITSLRNQLTSLSSAVARFKEKFVQLVHDKAQLMINAYLKGDLAEIEKRQYYYSGNRTYTTFLQQLHLALKLSTPLSYLENLLLTQEQYLTGLNTRLEMETSLKTDSLLQAALASQYKALKYNPYAPYINNEIGNLYTQKKMYDSADYHFTIASVLAPTWAIPWSNKIKLNLATNNLPKAKEAIKNAMALQPNLGFVKVNAGLVMEKEKNWLAAATYYQEAIAQNNIHYLPFERLGMVYIETGDFAKADYYFYEAKKRKQDFTINDEIFSRGIALNVLNKPFVETDSCLFDLSNLNITTKSYIAAKSGLTLLIENKDSVESKKMFLNALSLNADVPLAHHYLGTIYFNEQQWQLAEDELKKAIKGFMQKSALQIFLNETLKTDTGLYSFDCVIESFLENHYDERSDYYMLAKLYEAKGADSAALALYEAVTLIENKRLLEQAAFVGFKDIIWSKKDLQIDKMERYTGHLHYKLNNMYNDASHLSGFFYVAQFYEKMGNLSKAEDVYINQLKIVQQAAEIRKQVPDTVAYKPASFLNDKINKYWYNISGFVERSTYLFYNRMLALNPLDPDPIWKEKAGLFLYRRLAITYNQLPAKEQPVFYKTLREQSDNIKAINIYTWDTFINSLPEYGYPLLQGVRYYFGDYQMQPIFPEVSKYVDFRKLDLDPVAEALDLMKKAVELSGDIRPRREIREALADLYCWTNNPDDAIPVYTELVNEQPNDVSLRNKLISKQIAFERLVEACNNLDTLYKSKQIAQDQILTLAYFQLLSGQKNKTTTIIKNYRPANAGQKDSLMNLYAKLLWLNNQPKKALVYLKDSLKGKAIIKSESWRPIYHQNDKAFFRLYAIARMYGMTNKYKQAIAVLDSLLAAGFVYNYMLNKDPIWNRIKNNASWQKISNISFKQFMNYEEEKADNLNNGRWFEIPLTTFYAATGRERF
jgi:predicted Zn-dependent protease